MKTPPSRTCLGCRRARPKTMLVRLVRRSSGTVVADLGTRPVGRGAYVCPTAECVERALSRNRLGHAFKKPSEASPDLASILRSAGRDEGAPRASEASPGAVLLCEVGTGAIVQVDVISESVGR